MSCIDAVFWMLQSQVLGQSIRRKTSRFFVGHRPPHVCLYVYLVSCMWLSPRPSPSVFAYYKWSKTGGRNDAIILLCGIFKSINQLGKENLITCIVEYYKLLYVWFDIHPWQSVLTVISITQPLLKFWMSQRQQMGAGRLFYCYQASW